MDVHRCRFVEYPPSAINALAFSHDSGATGRNQPLRLAIGRANGDIEIWDPANGNWIHEITLRGGKDRTVEGLAWVHDPDETDENGYTTYGKLRLFSIGYSNAITEWDLITGLPSRQSTGSHGDIWCIAAQPAWKKSDNQNAHSKEDTGEFRGQHLAAGCADGSVILFSTTDDSLNFQKYISRSFKKKARTLCLAWQNRSTIVAGFSDSAIRVYDTRNGNLIRNLSLAGGPRGAPKETLVWALECLQDGTVVSGDSNGEVCFWDKYNYGQLQRIKGHQADVLCVASSDKGRTVFSGGMDRRTVVYGQNESRRWNKTAHRRFHQHDVKTMARFENSKFSLVVSGGLDNHPIVIPAREFGTENHRKLPYTPQMPPVASGGRLVASWWNTQVTIWRVWNASSQLAKLDDIGGQLNYGLMASMTLSADEYITSASMSSRGDLLAIATVAEIKVFSLQPRRKTNPSNIKIKKLEIPSEVSSQGARLVKLSPDCKWLAIIDCSSRVRLARVAESSEQPQKYQVLQDVHTLRRLRRDENKQNCLNGPWGSYNRTITRAAFSSNSRTLAVSDLAGHVDTWILKGDEDFSKPTFAKAKHRRNTAESSSSSSSDSDSASDSAKESNAESKVPRMYGQHWRRNPAAHLVPKMPSTPLVLSFQPITTLSCTGNEAADNLLITTSTHEIHIISVLSGRLTPWSRRNAASSSSTLLPEEFRLHRDRAVDCVWDVSSETRGVRAWLYGSSWICMFDLTQDIPRLSEESQEGKVNAVHGTDDEHAGGSGKFLSTSVTQRGKKRKFEPAWEEERESEMHQKLQSKRHTTGAAGSHIRDEEMTVALNSSKMRRLDKEGKRQPVELRPNNRVKSQDKDSEDRERESSESETENNHAAFAAARRQNSYLKAEPSSASSSEEDGGADEPEKEQPKVNGIKHHPESSFEEDEDIGMKRHGQEITQPGHPPSFYITTKYRPILGIVPLVPLFENPVDRELNGQSLKESANLSQNKSTHHPSTEHTREVKSSQHDDNDRNEHIANPSTRPTRHKRRAGRKRRKSKPAVADELLDEDQSEDEEGREQEGILRVQNPLPEFAIIERPFWDLDLPPRYVGNQEWEKSDYS